MLRSLPHKNVAVFGKHSAIMITVLQKVYGAAATVSELDPLSAQSADVIFYPARDIIRIYPDPMPFPRTDKTILIAYDEGDVFPLEASTKPIVTYGYECKPLLSLHEDVTPAEQRRLKLFLYYNELKNMFIRIWEVALEYVDAPKPDAVERIRGLMLVGNWLRLFKDEYFSQSIDAILVIEVKSSETMGDIDILRLLFPEEMEALFAAK